MFSRNFQSFDSATAGGEKVQYQDQNIYGGNPYLNPTSGYGANFYTPSSGQNFGTADEFEDEPPLLEGMNTPRDLFLISFL